MSEDIFADEKWIWEPECMHDTDNDQHQATISHSESDPLDTPVEVYVIEQTEGEELNNTLSQLKEEPQEENFFMPPPATRSGGTRRQRGRAAHPGQTFTAKSTKKRLGLRFVTTTKRMQPSSGDEYSSSEEAEGQVLHPKRPRVTILTVEQERNVAEWLQEHELFYNKKLNDYKDVRKKYRLLQEKADELNVHVNQLRTWIDGMRTRFGRLCATRSAVMEMTEREQWIYTTFRFLQPHIVRCPTRQSKKLPTRKELTVQTATTSQDELAVQCQGSTDTPPLAAPSSSTPSSSSVRTPPSASASLAIEDQDLLQKLSEQYRQNQAIGIQNRLLSALQPQSPHVRQVTHFMSFLGSLCETMTPAAWRSFSAKAHQLALEHLTTEAPQPSQPPTPGPAVQPVLQRNDSPLPTQQTKQQQQQMQ
ncbi:uncharacterized protein LOC135103308 [Scylla paramamosain]|uniref:uncharacterized protein LOC135103308 n=1 Tax=Scylla paramamosain TaxID=85552 RepID=UPI003082A36B